MSDLTGLAVHVQDDALGTSLSLLFYRADIAPDSVTTLDEHWTVNEYTNNTIQIGEVKDFKH